MLFAQTPIITMEQVTDAAMSPLPINPLTIIIAAILIWVFRARIGDAFEFLRSKAQKDEAAKVAPAAPSPEKVADEQEPAKPGTPAKVRVIPGPELVYLTLTKAGIKDEDAQEFVKTHLATILANQKAKSVSNASAQ